MLTVEAFQDMEELIEDLREFQDFYQSRDKEQMIPWEEAKQRMILSNSARLLASVRRNVL